MTQQATATGKGILAMLKEAFADFIDDDAMTQAAAVAFYTALSFAPLLLLTVFLFGKLDEISGYGTEQRVVDEIRNLMGGEAAGVVEDVQQQQEEKPQLSLLSLTGIIALVTLVWSASGVFAQLQAALNTIWDVEQAPGNGLMGFLRKRGLSVGVVFAILFLLLASLVVTAIIAAVFRGVGGGDSGVLWQGLNFVISLVVYVGLFGLIFKYLPDVKIPWMAVWFGAVVTACLFAIGKWAIGLYLGKSDPGSAYGAAGSVVVLLVWVYYSAIIVFLGAEVTQVWAKRKGYRIVPSQHAQAAHSRKQGEPANDAAIDKRAKA